LFFLLFAHRVVFYSTNIYGITTTKPWLLFHLHKAPAEGNNIKKQFHFQLLQLLKLIPHKLRNDRMLLIIIRTLILYGATVLLLRVMGKRQIGQLQPYELVVIIMISELAAIPMQNIGIPLLSGLIPIFILVAVQVLLSLVSLYSEKARGTICGKPSIVIANSRIVEEELRRLRYNLNDLLEQLRLKDVPDIGDVEYAILETSGELSVILKSEKRPLIPQDLNISPEREDLPTTLIIDGRIINENLTRVGHNTDWLRQELERAEVNDIKDVFFASLDAHGQLYWQLKSSVAGDRNPQ
jgi:uncharacterized membrane protein YcaP (DUF421 family)